MKALTLTQETRDPDPGDRRTRAVDTSARRSGAAAIAGDAGMKPKPSPPESAAIEECRDGAARRVDCTEGGPERVVVRVFGAVGHAHGSATSGEVYRTRTEKR